MGNGTVSKRTLRIGTALVWMGVLLGASFFTEAESGRNLDWELMWVIVGGFLIQITLIGLYTGKDKNE